MLGDVGVRVFGSNAVFGQCAGRARELDAVGEEALAGGGKLEIRHRNRDHTNILSVSVWAGRCRRQGDAHGTCEIS
jgi:hypothetical protein